MFMERRVISIALICIGLAALAFGLALGQHEIIQSYLQELTNAYLPYLPPIP